MKNSMLFSLVVFLCIGLYNSPPAANARIWEIDKEHTNFYFSVDHIYSKVQGRFKDYEGKIIFDPDNLDSSEISFEIKVKSVDTGLSKRDRHLRSKDFFDSSKYPLMTFTSKNFSKAGENTYTVSGTLTIKDVTSEIEFPLTYAGSSDHPFLKNTEVAGFNGRLSLDRLAYNVGTGHYYEIGAVGKTVDILVTIEVLGKK